MIHDLDLALAPSTLTHLTGANSSGKTTLLRVVAGLTIPTRGRVDGRSSRVAVVPDRFAPPARMTPRAYLGHHGRIRGLDPAAADRRAAEVGEQLGVVPHLGVPIQELSKGNIQKVALAQAFLAPVDLLVMEEPRTALDARAAAALDRLLALDRDRIGQSWLWLAVDAAASAVMAAALAVLSGRVACRRF